MGLFGSRWTWDRLQKHKEACVTRALACGYIQGLLRKLKLGEADLRDFYMRMSDAGTEPEQRETAMTNPILLERYWESVREAKGRLDPTQVAVFGRWVRTNPRATLPQ